MKKIVVCTIAIITVSAIGLLSFALLPQKLDFYAITISTAASRADSIGGLSLSDGADAIVGVLGEPLSVKKFTVGYIAGGNDVPFVTYCYDGLEVTFDNAEKKSIWEISTTSSVYATDMGVAVGDSVEKLDKAYECVVNGYASPGSVSRDVRTDNNGNTIIIYSNGALERRFTIDKIVQKIIKISFNYWSA